jgi:hypothetical protein
MSGDLIMLKSQMRLPILAVSAAFALGAAMGPAHALKDDGSGSPIESLGTAFGLIAPPADPVITYRERSPLVLPPSTTSLPAPRKPVVQGAQNWPQDQEVVRARRNKDESPARLRGEAAADENARLKPGDNRNVYAPSRSAGPVNGPGAGDPCANLDPDNKNCPPDQYWKRLSVQHQPQAQNKLQAGVEPPRTYLTQPPKGYMTPTSSNVKAGFEPRRNDVVEDPRDFYWKRGQSRE